jgi:hypothetical protein
MLRASQMPLAMACPASAHPAPDEILIDQVGEPARLGSAVHLLLSHEAGNDAPTDAQISEVAEEYACDTKELTMLYRFGARAWGEMVERGWIPGGLQSREVELSSQALGLSGHVDLQALSEAGDKALVLDWKSGRLDHDYSEQMNAYAALMFFTHPQLTEVTTAIVWLREQSVESSRHTRASAQAWVARLQDEVVDWDGRTYRPGPHCTWCRRAVTCPARTAMARQAVAVLVPEGALEKLAADLPAMPDVQKAAVYRAARLVEALAGDVKELVKSHMLATDRRPIDCGDGKELQILEVQRREVDVLLALPVLSARMTEAEVASCLSCSVSKAEDVVASKAVRGKKKGAIEAFGNELAEAGAVTINAAPQLREVRKVEPGQA